MSLHNIISLLSRSPSFEKAATKAAIDADFSLTDGLRVPLLVGLLEERVREQKPQALFVITATSREAESLHTSFACVMPNAEIIDFPAWETLPHERLSPSAETVGQRFFALQRMAEWAAEGASSPGEGPSSPAEGASKTQQPLIILASVRAALQPLAPNLVDFSPLTLTVGDRGKDLSSVAATLVDFAYSRVDIVTRRGEFAVRGGILDVFSSFAEHPVRIDFFGDEIEQLRFFSVADQRSLPEPVSEIICPPSRELLLTESVRERARQAHTSFPNLGDMFAKIAEGITVEGMESLAPVLVDHLVPVTHYLPPGTAIAVIAPERVATRAISLAETNREFLDAAWNAASVGAEAPIDLAAGDFLTLKTLRETANKTMRVGGKSHGVCPWWTLSSFHTFTTQDDGENIHNDTGISDIEDLLTLRIEGHAIPSFQGKSEGAIEYVATRLRAGGVVVIVVEGVGLGERARDVLAEHEIPVRIVDALPVDCEPGIAYVVRGRIDHGFDSDDARLSVLSEMEFYGRAVGVDSRQVTKLASRRKNVVDPLQLKAGDYVVHDTHGIGKFVELTQREVSSGGRNAVKTKREYLVVEYAPSKRGYPGDKLYVPTDQLDQLTRYVGGEAPALNKMGGSDWAATKGKARKAVRDIAVELVKLYSQRMSQKGYAFSPDTPWQRELEEAFPFVETPDQLQTINEVKADMEKSIPMDRLLSGDVGFGKTEVAIRATFKAVQDGKQVVVLVPTTLLVKQHIETFQNRFAGFPVRVRPLSRFQTLSEARETLAGLADGTVDVVIGTHRVLTESVKFKDLGLVIIDEEQRFGVEHKDALKKLKTNVDILAMSATPIPRTLEMAVTGIREMSTLATPPEDRHPILTFVGPASDKQIAAAIRREILREGQVFFVHNRVSSINRVAAHVAELVPEARIGVAHGQLNENILEKVVMDFWERKFDVLVSTTIIETGLDIQNANTIIIDRADKYGLSQLHQLRGRVGRGRERAYAYFLYDSNMPLSETAHDRLSTIAANNELGSGMHVALKDLEIRGAGNLLGGEQAGSIAGVGFDLYVRMVGEAVSTFRGEQADGPTELRLELPVDAHIPESYIDSERLRLEAYQKLSNATSAPDNAHIDQVLEEITDRYGEPPEQVVTLIEVSRLRRCAQKFGLAEVVVMGSNLRIAPAQLADSVETRLKRLYPQARYMRQTSVISVPFPQREGRGLPDRELIGWVAELLNNIFAPFTGGMR